MTQRLEALGMDYPTIQTLRRISMTLQRWFELECGDSDNYASWAIERDEESDLPYRVVHRHQSPGAVIRYRIADREKGARKRLAAIMAQHPGLIAYVQGDPRGCALHILRKEDVRDGEEIDSVYTRGIAVW